MRRMEKTLDDVYAALGVLIDEVRSLNERLASIDVSISDGSGYVGERIDAVGSDVDRIRSELANR
jgi:hypothetical protein